MLIDLQLKGELIYRKTANINVKNLYLMYLINEASKHFIFFCLFKSSFTILFTVRDV